MRSETNNSNMFSDPFGMRGGGGFTRGGGRGGPFARYHAGQTSWEQNQLLHAGDPFARGGRGGRGGRGRGRGGVGLFGDTDTDDDDISDYTDEDDIEELIFGGGRGRGRGRGRGATRGRALPPPRMVRRLS